MSSSRELPLPERLGSFGAAPAATALPLPERLGSFGVAPAPAPLFPDGREVSPVGAQVPVRVLTRDPGSRTFYLDTDLAALYLSAFGEPPPAGGRTLFRIGPRAWLGASSTATNGARPGPGLRVELPAGHVLWVKQEGRCYGAGGGRPEPYTIPPGTTEIVGGRGKSLSSKLGSVTGGAGGGGAGLLPGRGGECGNAYPGGTGPSDPRDDLGVGGGDATVDAEGSGSEELAPGAGGLGVTGIAVGFTAPTGGWSQERGNAGGDAVELTLAHAGKVLWSMFANDLGGEENARLAGGGGQGGGSSGVAFPPAAFPGGPGGDLAAVGGAGQQPGGAAGKAVELNGHAIVFLSQTSIEGAVS